MVRITWNAEQQAVVFRELIRLGGLEAATFTKHQDAIAKTLDCTPRSIYELYVRIKRETRDNAPNKSPTKRKEVDGEPDGAKTPKKKQAKVATPKKGKAKTKLAEADDDEEAASVQKGQGANAIMDEWSD